MTSRMGMRLAPRLGIIWLVCVLLTSSCGKYGPPERIERTEPQTSNADPSNAEPSTAEPETDEASDDDEPAQSAP